MMALAWLLSNLWRSACIGLVLALAVSMWAGKHWQGKFIAAKAENALAADANEASQAAINSLKADLVRCNRRVAVYVDTVKAVEADRAKQAAKDAAKLKASQDSLRKALAANPDWDNQPVPDAVRRAIR